jgi:hypothetical protein
MRGLFIYFMEKMFLERFMKGERGMNGIDITEEEDGFLEREEKIGIRFERERGMLKREIG